MKDTNPEHEFTIKCIPCDEEITTKCVMKVLEFMTKHKECLKEKEEENARTN